MSDRDNRGRFTQGNKGGGRKKLPRELYEAFTNASGEAFRTIIEVMQDENERADLRLKAAMFIIDKGCGNALSAYQVHETDCDLNPQAHIFDDLGL